MRRLTTAQLVEDFMAELGRAVHEAVNVYFTGGVTAVLHGFRETTIDVDISIVPDSDAVLRAIPEIKESLGLNVELAAPDQFVPELPGSSSGAEDPCRTSTTTCTPRRRRKSRGDTIRTSRMSGRCSTANR